MATFITLGIHIVDILVYPVTQIPGGQTLALVEQVRTTVAGSAAGTAIDMARLGLKVRSIGAIGDDTRGDFLISTMQNSASIPPGLSGSREAKLPVVCCRSVPTENARFCIWSGQAGN
jgi:sugar/nucleoside kinase (ribokinase family)